MIRTTVAVKKLHFVAVCWLVLHALPAQSQSIPDDVQAALEGYSELSPLAVRLHATVQQQNRESTRETHYFRQGDRFSWLSVYVDGEHKHKIHYRFDGRVVSSSHGDFDASWYDIDKLKEKQPAVSDFDVKYFDAAGLYYPKRHDELQNGALRSAILEALAGGAELVSCENANVNSEKTVKIEIDSENPAWHAMLNNYNRWSDYESTRLKNKNIEQEEFDEMMSLLEAMKANTPQRLRHQYYLSADNQFAVSRYEVITPAGQVVAAYSNDGFQQVPGSNSSLPMEVNAMFFEHSSKYLYTIEEAPFTSEKIAVTDIALNLPSDVEFVLDRTKVAPGARIIDAVSPGMQRNDGSVVTYEMPDSPDNLDKVVAAAKGQYPTTKSSSSRSVLIVVNVILLVLVCGVFLKKRWRK